MEMRKRRTTESVLSLIRFNECFIVASKFPVDPLEVIFNIGGRMPKGRERDLVECG